MTVKELKIMLKSIPDDCEILLSGNIENFHQRFHVSSITDRAAEGKCLVLASDELKDCLAIGTQYITKDMESAEPDYVRETLESIGTTEEQLYALELDWLIL